MSEILEQVAQLSQRPKRWFALDTSTPYASLALVDGDLVVAEQCFWSGTGHSQQILSQLESMLTLVDWELSHLEAMVVGCGPGSFTGLRVGVSTAQGLAWALDIPLVGVSSLEAWAWSAPISSERWVISCVDARKDQVYTSFHRLEEESLVVPQPSPLFASGHAVTGHASKATCSVLRACSSPLMLSPKQLGEAIACWPEPVMLVGTGASVYGAMWAEKAPKQLRWPAQPISLRGSALVALAQREMRQGKVPSAPWSVLPLYVRAADAELQRNPEEIKVVVSKERDEEASFWLSDTLADLHDVLFSAG